MKGILVLAAVVFSALALSAGASANSLTCNHGVNCNKASLGKGPGGSSGGSPGTSGTLPFTGLDLAGMAGVFGLLLVSGVTLQRVSRRRR